MTLARYDDHPAGIQQANPWIELMGPAADLANNIAQTGFVPQEFRNKPAEIAACILYGAEIGVGPMQSLAKIDIVKGRPAPRAELGRALAMAAGHEVWTVESTNSRVTVAGRRKGSQNVQQVTWTMDDAKRAGLTSNPTYTKYPRQMLLARASAELVRQMCPDVLGGISVFAEEAADLDDITTTPAAAPSDTPSPAPTGTTKRRRTQAATTPAPEPTDQPDPTPEAEAEDDGPTRAQTDKAMAMFTEQGYSDRTDRLAATSAILGRPVETWTSLTRDEASQVIDSLERLAAGELTLIVNLEGPWQLVHEADELFPDDAA